MKDNTGLTRPVPSLTPSEEPVLLYLLKHGPTYGYDIFNQLHTCAKLKTNKTTATALNSLTQKGLLTKHLVKNTKTHLGLPKQVYRLTLYGLFVSLNNIKESWNEIDSISKQWEELLPFVFSRWRLFQKNKLTEVMNDLLKSSIQEFWFDRTIDQPEHQFVSSQINLVSQLNNRIREDIEIVITEALLHSSQEVVNKWSKILANDSYWKKKANMYLRQLLNGHEACVNRLKIMKDVIFPMLDHETIDWTKTEQVIKDALSRVSLLENMRAHP